MILVCQNCTTFGMIRVSIAIGPGGAVLLQRKKPPGPCKTTHKKNSPDLLEQTGRPTKEGVGIAHKEETCEPVRLLYPKQ